jgi:aminoglycoside 6-adenylyltransferase
LVLPEESEVLAKVVAWAEGDPSVRTMILTSSRARGDGEADALSDYDVIVAVRDAAEFAASDAWAQEYGEPLVRWNDQGELDGETTYFRGVVYRDGAKIDYTVWPEALLERVSKRATLPDVLDVGYRILLDKDASTSDWRPPSHRAHIPAKPTKDQYDALVDEFWWDTTYVAKGLWRGEVIFVKFALDHDAKFGALRRFLEWRIEIDHEWSLKPGAYGRGIERLLPADIWSELASTYVGIEAENNWSALFRTTALFRRVATEVGDALGYTYPQDVDDAVTAQLERVRELPPG